MSFKIIGSFDQNILYCTGSLTKFLTTYVSLSILSEKYQLPTIIDDVEFLDSLCVNQSAKDFLTIFQKLLGGKFSIHDLCTYYAGLPYTFDLANDELERTDMGHAFRHHSILDEETFLNRCKNNITPVYTPKSRFNYSEISIIFLGYFLEKVYGVSMEVLYQKFIINKFKLEKSIFSRTIPKDAYIQDLSDVYDYPSIGIADHGYFCYSNGFYTTLNDMKKLLDHLIDESVFQFMVDLKYARAASNRLMNGLTLEIRMTADDLLYGYEGLSFSGCNLWAYSTKLKQGYLIFYNSEEEVYSIIYDELFGYKDFSLVPPHTQEIYKKFIKNYHDLVEPKDIPDEYQGNYQRVLINTKVLPDTFVVGKDFIIIRNPETIKYEVIYVNGHFCIKNKDGIHGEKVEFYQAKSGHRYMCFQGNLYRKC